MHQVTKTGAMSPSREPDWCTQALYASVIYTRSVTDDCFSSLSPRCSLSDVQLYIHVLDNSEVQNGSSIRSRKRAPRNSLVCGLILGQSHADFLAFILFWTLDHRIRLVPIATTFSFKFSTYHHQSALLNLGIAIAVRQVTPALLWKKERKFSKKNSWP